MLKAELHGKLGALASSEDVLTSSVFGALEYLGNVHLLSAIVADARDREGRRVGLPVAETPSSFELYFWPQTSTGKEPDLVLILQLEGRGPTVAVLIEVKYMSGLSPDEAVGVPEGDACSIPEHQLLHYSEVLQRALFSSPELRASVAQCQHRMVLYLTADFDSPFRTELRDLNVADVACPIYWLSWTDISAAVCSAARDDSAASAGHRRLLADLAEVLCDRRELRPFEGIVSTLKLWDTPSANPLPILRTEQRKFVEGGWPVLERRLDSSRIGLAGFGVQAARRKRRPR